MSTSESLVLFERTYQYSVDVAEGKIIACKRHIQACRRFLKDLDRIHDDSYPYYFDIEEAYKIYKWASMFKHTKGVLAGQNIELMDFSLFIVSNIFCWKRKDTNNRRYKKSYIQLARKNMKSQLLALISSYENFLSEEQSEVYIAGWGREQSSIVYNEILGQIRECDLLKGKYSDSYGKITHTKSGSVIQPLSKESRKTGDGKNPSFAVIDEFHCHETSEIYDVLISGMVARANGHICIITTAGFNIASPCYREYQYVCQIIDEHSQIENDEYFVMICELDKEDDIKDERNWAKCNPIVSTYSEGMDFLRSELRAALDVPEKMRNFLTKNMNRWVDQKENGYMSLEKWNDCGASEDNPLPDIKNREVYIGIDLSAEHDLTSVSFLIPVENEKMVVLSHSFLPEDTLQKKMKTDKVDYALWVKQGWISATPGGVVDYRFVRNYIKKQIELHNWTVKEIGYDDWNAAQFTNEMLDEGFMMVKIGQGIKALALPTKEFRAQVYKGNIIHDNNPVLNWAIGNAVTVIDPNENFKLDKSKSRERIDPIASVITGYARGMHYHYLKESDLNKFITDDILDKIGW